MPQIVIIVEKNGELKTHNIKEYKEDELFKKCGLKKSTGFGKQVDWNIKYEGKKYVISMYGKLDGKVNTENKYDFPPPIDSKLFFGNCLLVGFVKNELNPKELTPISLTINLWDKLYEKLFGGFEDLTSSAIEDEEEDDELENIPKSLKTKKGGYLKDGFVVDSDEDDEDEDEYETETESIDIHDKIKKNTNNCQETEDFIIDEIGSELSEEPYEYSVDDYE
jgi:hypothetical protein